MTEHHHRRTAQPTKKMEEEKEQEIIEGLDAIYGHDEKIDFNKIDKAQNKLTRLLVIAVLTLTIIAMTTWSGFFVYTQFFNTHNKANFSLSIEMNTEIMSGEETQIDILYSNPTTVPIATLVLDANIPSSFQIENISITPTDRQKLIWNIGELPGLSDGKITITGIWVAENPSETPVQIYANYKPANFNADFEEIAVEYITTTDSVLKTEITGLEETSPGDSSNYEISIENTSEHPLADITTELILPNGFYIETSDPAIEAGSAPVWTIGEITPLETVKIKFSGSFAADIQDFQYFTVNTDIISEQRSLLQSTTQTYTDVLASDFSIQLVANGRTDITNIDLNRNLRISIAYENNNDIALDNNSILLDFQSDNSIPINWSDVSLDGGIITRDGILWNKNTLGVLEPDEKKMLSTNFPIDNSIGVGDSDTFTIVAKVTSEHGTVQSSPIIINIISEAKLSTIIKYYDDSGNAIGNGPLPPQVAENTTYKIFWKIENSIHNLKDIRVTATLPPQVKWLDQTSVNIGDIDYNEDTKTIIWKISELSTDVPSIEANFVISITPNSDDVGKFVKLISSSSISAKDENINETIIRSTDSLTTDLINDPFAIDKGIVIE